MLPSPLSPRTTSLRPLYSNRARLADFAALAEPRDWKNLIRRARAALLPPTAGFLLLTAAPCYGQQILESYPTTDSREAASPEEVSQLAGFLGFGLSDSDGDDGSSDPFTLQGSTEKQYSIDEMNGTKIVRRRRGVTTKTCIKVAVSPTDGGKPEAPEKALCRSAEDKADIKKACQSSCRTACSDSLEEYRVSIGEELGLPPSKQSLARPQRSCARSCSYECQKEGSGYKFTINSNR